MSALSFYFKIKENPTIPLHCFYFESLPVVNSMPCIVIRSATLQPYNLQLSTYPLNLYLKPFVDEIRSDPIEPFKLVVRSSQSKTFDEIFEEINQQLQTLADEITDIIIFKIRFIVRKQTNLNL